VNLINLYIYTYIYIYDVLDSASDLELNPEVLLALTPGKFCMYTCVYIYIYVYLYMYMYTGCPRRNVLDFGRVFLMLKYTDITQNTYVQS